VSVTSSQVALEITVASSFKRIQRPYFKPLDPRPCNDKQESNRTEPKPIIEHYTHRPSTESVLELVDY